MSYLCVHITAVTYHHVAPPLKKILEEVSRSTVELWLLFVLSRGAVLEQLMMWPLFFIVLSFRVAWAAVSTDSTVHLFGSVPIARHGGGWVGWWVWRLLLCCFFARDIDAFYSFLWHAFLPSVIPLLHGRLSHACLLCYVPVFVVVSRS